MVLFLNGFCFQGDFEGIEEREKEKNAKINQCQALTTQQWTHNGDSIVRVGRFKSINELISYNNDIMKPVHYD